MKIISTSIRTAVGLVFILSGLVKLNDPLGTAIKLEEYFSVFAFDGLGFFDALTPFSLFFSFLLVVSEVVLGLALLIRYRLWWVSGSVLGLIAVFTLLTFYSAYFNKVTDCGCFGDAIKLTPWQSFTKDVVLLFLVLAWMFLMRRGSSRPQATETTTDSENEHILLVAWRFALRRGPSLTQATEATTDSENKHTRQRRNDILMLSVTLFSIALGLYAVLFLPFLDFRSYKRGADILQMRQPSAALRYGYEFMKGDELIVRESYTSDSTYQFVGTKLLNPEAMPKIQDYALWNEENDLTEASLTGKKLLIVVQRAGDIASSSASRIGKLAEALPSDIEAWVVTSSSRDEYESLKESSTEIAALPYCFADATLLKTMIRSNPGFVLLEEGTVKEKWSHYAFPEIADLEKALQ